MAVERRFVRVSEYDEEMVADEYSWFGWTLVGNQDVHQENVAIEYFALQPWLVNHTTDYVKLVFEREKNNPNYDKLVEMEEQYYQSMEVSVNCGNVKFGWIRGFLCAFLILAAIGGATESVIGAVICLALAILIIVLRIRKIKKEHALSDYALEKAREAKEEAEKLF